MIGGLKVYADLKNFDSSCEEWFQDRDCPTLDVTCLDVGKNVLLKNDQPTLGEHSDNFV